MVGQRRLFSFRIPSFFFPWFHTMWWNLAFCLRNREATLYNRYKYTQHFDKHANMKALCCSVVHVEILQMYESWDEILRTPYTRLLPNYFLKRAQACLVANGNQNEFVHSTRRQKAFGVTWTDDIAWFAGVKCTTHKLCRVFTAYSKFCKHTAHDLFAMHFFCLLHLIQLQFGSSGTDLSFFTLSENHNYFVHDWKSQSGFWSCPQTFQQYTCVSETAALNFWQTSRQDFFCDVSHPPRNHTSSVAESFYFWLDCSRPIVSSDDSKHITTRRKSAFVVQKQRCQLLSFDLMDIFHSRFPF